MISFVGHNSRLPESRPLNAQLLDDRYISKHSGRSVLIGVLLRLKPVGTQETHETSQSSDPTFHLISEKDIYSLSTIVLSYRYANPLATVTTLYVQGQELRLPERSSIHRLSVFLADRNISKTFYHYFGNTSEIRVTYITKIFTAYQTNSMELSPSIGLPV
jgi:hypothetical protein